MSINTNAQIQDPYIQTIFEQAMFVARDNNVMVPLVTVFTDRNDSSPRSSSEHAQVTMHNIGASDDLASQAFTPSVLATLTPAEAGAQYLLEDQRRATDPFSVQQSASIELGMGMAQKIETDILSNFASLTGGTVGTAGSAMTWAYFSAAITRLRNQNAPGPYFAVMHPYQYHDLAANASVVGQSFHAGDLADAIQNRWWVGRALGTDIYLSSNISIDDADDAMAGVFSRMALAYDSRRAPRLEPQRDASRRATELNMTAVYAHGIWRPRFGVQIVTDASAPTGEE